MTKKGNNRMFLKLLFLTGFFFNVLFLENTLAAMVDMGLQCVPGVDTCKGNNSVCAFPASGGATAYCGVASGQVSKKEDGISCTAPSECAGGFCETSSTGQKVCGHKASVYPKANVNTSPTSKKFNYTLLESFPGFFAAGSTLTDLPKMILSIYKFGIWTVGIAGLFMLVVGGFMYMASAGNTSTAGNARSIIWDSLIGIVAALGAYLLLYVINPDLTRINLNFTPVNVKEVDTMPSGGAILAEGRLTDKIARQNLAAAGIRVNKDNCSNPQATNCTSLDGIPAITIGNLIALQNACRQYNANCKMMVTGGTEAGHDSHGPGNPMIDIREDAVTAGFLSEVKAKKQYASFGIGQVCTVAQQNLGSISYNHAYDKTCKDPSVIAHFHFSFSG